MPCCPCHFWRSIVKWYRLGQSGSRSFWDPDWSCQSSEDFYGASFSRGSQGEGYLSCNPSAKKGSRYNYMEDKKREWNKVDETLFFCKKVSPLGTKWRMMSSLFFFFSILLSTQKSFLSLFAKGSEVVDLCLNSTPFCRSCVTRKKYFFFFSNAFPFCQRKSKFIAIYIVF